jgi:hypothetical protein
MDYEEEVENMIFEWITMLPEDEQKMIKSPWDVEAALNEEVEDEMKNEVWRMLKNNLGYRGILLRLLQKFQDEESDDEEIVQVDSEDE